MIAEKKIKTICVCGAGTMGSGIAQVAAAAGFSVIQFDVNKEMLAKSKQLIEKNLTFLLERKKISEEEKRSIIARIFFSGEIKYCIADVIIEAIIEDMETKIELFNSLAKINNAETIFASNTSSISISAIASQAKFKSNVVGMHFFNPAPLMRLVEIIKGNETAETIAQQTFQLAKDLGKTPVMCKDVPGFIVNRVARQYYLEAMKLVENDLATIETVDAAMEAAGFKMGPFKLMDLIGLDVNFSVSKIVYENLGKPGRLMPSALQRNKVEAKELGRKTGKGFYEY